METTNAARLAALLADSDAAFEACMEGRLTLSEATAIDALYLDAMVASGTPVPLFDAVTPWSPRV